MRRADLRCQQSGDDDREAVEILDIACYLTDRWWFLYRDAIDVQALQDEKTCGLFTLEIEPSEGELGVGETLTMRAVARDRNGEIIEGYFDDGDPEVIWSVFGSSAELIDGPDILVRGLRPGSATINARVLQGQCLDFRAQAQVDVGGDRIDLMLVFSHNAAMGMVYGYPDTFPTGGDALHGHADEIQAELSARFVSPRIGMVTYEDYPIRPWGGTGSPNNVPTMKGSKVQLENTIALGILEAGFRRKGHEHRSRGRASDRRDIPYRMR